MNRFLGLMGAAAVGAGLVNANRRGDDGKNRMATFKYLPDIVEAGNANPVDTFSQVREGGGDLRRYNGIVANDLSDVSAADEEPATNEVEKATTGEVGEAVTAEEEDKKSTAGKKGKKKPRKNLRGFAEVEVEDGDVDKATSLTNFTVDLSDMFFKVGEDLLEGIVRGNDTVRQLLEAAAQSDSIDVELRFHCRKKAPAADNRQEGDEDNKSQEVSAEHFCPTCQEGFVEGAPHFCKIF